MLVGLIPVFYSFMREKYILYVFTCLTFSRETKTRRAARSHHQIVQPFISLSYPLLLAILLCSRNFIRQLHLAVFRTFVPGYGASTTACLAPVVARKFLHYYLAVLVSFPFPARGYGAITQPICSRTCASVDVCVCVCA